ncbi:MAG: hypothetical protein HPY59_07955 [Anaerolineae bacterium]|nr:hypothetical protein [Anaerolineae bacterium]
MRIAPQLHPDYCHPEPPTLFQAAKDQRYLHEFGSGDRRVQSRNDPKKALKAGVFPLLGWCIPLVQTLIAWFIPPGVKGFAPGVNRGNGLRSVYTNGVNMS